ncbi:hypothetical protein HPB50_018060 [Hyalomma asiaticum]|uniref:Uncharacterized protein n=1 Tax=Hyalomma asiaticum TaxID=266040 RepID=A0ACB7TQZ7_HYAAI|nr:hypothetical protein HPB50_018060 [Hyalomma asiaticum]
MCRETKEIMQEARTTPRKWTTNSDGLINTLEYVEEFGGKELAVVQGTSLKVLGIPLNPRTDNFTFSLRGLLRFMNGIRDTKRFVLRTASRISDPMGSVAPFTIAIRNFFRML